MSHPEIEATRPSADELPALLGSVLEKRFGAGTVLQDWRAPEQGFSTESFLFTCVEPDGAQRKLVFRRPPETPLFPDYDLLRQVLVMNRLASTDIKVPRVAWHDRKSAAVGTPYFVMEHIDAVGTASDLPSYHEAGLYLAATPEQRRSMWWGCIDTMAQVHRVDWKAARLDFLAYPSFGDTPLLQVVNYLHDAITWAAAGRPRPALERGLSWLRDNIYDPDHVVLCWGDGRLSNVLYGEQFEVRGVLDWEVAYLGDHEADLAWLLFLDWASTEHTGLTPLEGTPTRADAIARYESQSGWKVRNLRYNEVLAAVILACPLLRLESRYIDQGLVGEDSDFAEFCSVRVDQLLDASD